MSKNPKSLADRLILLVARLGERATVQNITGRHLVGVEFEQAKQDAKDLVVWEQIHQMRQRRPGWAPQRSRKASTTARLTKAGIWRAAQLGVPYSPGLVDALIAEKDRPAPHSRAEKQREAETAALVADGKEYRRQIAARKTAKDEAAKAALVGPRRKRSPRHYEKLNKFLVSRGMQPTKVPAFGNGLTLRQPDAKIPSPESAPRPIATPAEHRVQVTPATPVRARTFADDLAAIQGSQLASVPETYRGFSNTPRPADVAENARIIELFKKTPCSGELLPNGRIRYDNQDMTPRQWERERFKQAG
jgi:hypothetical protein